MKKERKHTQDNDQAHEERKHAQGNDQAHEKERYFDINIKIGFDRIISNDFVVVFALVPLIVTYLYVF